MKHTLTQGPFTFHPMQSVPEWEDAVGQIRGADGEYVCEIDDGASPEQAKANRAAILGLPKMIAALAEAQEAIDVLAQDVADEFPRRSENATDLAMRIRTILTEAGTQ